MFISPVTETDIEPDHLKTLFRYWENIKGHRKMPRRKDFRPEKIPLVLPTLALFDVIGDPPRYYARLVGTETVKAIGFDFTGKYLDEIPSLKAVKDRFDGIARNGSPYLYRGKLVWSEKNYLDYYALALPFSDDGKTVDKLMYGTLYYFPDEDRTMFNR